MTSSKIKLTSRKFYNKWMYKISLRQAGCAIFRNHSIEAIKKLCIDSSSVDRPYSIHQKAYLNRDNIIRLCSVLETYDSTIWTKRIENSNMDLYTNDLEFYHTIAEQFKDIVIHQFEPNPATIELLTNSPSIVAVKKLPHNRFQYKVYLLPHKIAGDREGKTKYIDWIKTQGTKITCTPAVEKWFIKTDWNWDRRYVLVEDEGTLLMLKLRNSEIIGRVYKYVVTDK